MVIFEQRVKPEMFPALRFNQARASGSTSLSISPSCTELMGIHVNCSKWTGRSYASKPRRNALKCELPFRIGGEALFFMRPNINFVISVSNMCKLKSEKVNKQATKHTHKIGNCKNFSTISKVRNESAYLLDL